MPYHRTSVAIADWRWSLPGLLLLGSVSATPRVELAAQSGVTSRADFERMAEYLASGGGRWRAPNPAFDPASPGSTEALGLWFERTLDGNALELTVVSHLADTTVVTTRSSWTWHRNRGQILYHEVSRSGRVRTGTTEFVDDTTFVTHTEAAHSDGRTTHHRGMNIMLEDDVHRTVSFERQVDGSWLEEGAFTWHLESEARVVRELPNHEDAPAEAKRYLRQLLGTWESHNEIYDDHGAVVGESTRQFTEVILLEHHLNLHASHGPDGTIDKAFRFYSPQDGRFYMIDVTWDGSWWVLSGDEPELMYSQPRKLSDGRSVILKFQHFDVRDDAFRAVMEVSFDGGETWTKRSHQTYRRLDP